LHFSKEGFFVAGKRPWKIGGHFSIEFSESKLLLKKNIHNLAGILAIVPAKIIIQDQDILAFHVPSHGFLLPLKG
jgi:hypothetical protein